MSSRKTKKGSSLSSPFPRKGSERAEEGPFLEEEKEIEDDVSSASAYGSENEPFIPFSSILAYDICSQELVRSFEA